MYCEPCKSLAESSSLLTLINRDNSPCELFTLRGSLPLSSGFLRRLFGQSTRDLLLWGLFRLSLCFLTPASQSCQMPVPIKSASGGCDILESLFLFQALLFKLLNLFSAAIRIEIYYGYSKRPWLSQCIKHDRSELHLTSDWDSEVVILKVILMTRRHYRLVGLAPYLGLIVARVTFHGLHHDVSRGPCRDHRLCTLICRDFPGLCPRTCHPCLVGLCGLGDHPDPAGHLPSHHASLSLRSPGADSGLGLPGRKTQNCKTAGTVGLTPSLTEHTRGYGQPRMECRFAGGAVADNVGEAYWTAYERRPTQRHKSSGAVLVFQKSFFLDIAPASHHPTWSTQTTAQHTRGNACC